MNLSKLLPNRRQVIVAHDIFMAAISFVLALLLRMGETIYSLPFDFIVQGTIIFTVIAASAFWYMGLYRGIWRYASTNDAIQITKAVTLTVLVFLPVLFLWSRAEFLPRSFPVINWFVLIALLGGPRFVFRLFKDRHFEFAVEPAGKVGIPVLLVGASDAAETFIREIARQRGTAYRIVGILDEKGRRVGRHIHNIPVLGTPESLPAILRRLALRGVRPQRLIATKQELSPELVRGLLDIAEANGMILSRLPRLTEFHSGAADRFDVRPVDVEDLLGRPQAVFRPAGDGAVDRREKCAHHWRRRHHRRRIITPSRQLGARATHPRRQQRIQFIRHRPGDQSAKPGPAPRHASGRRAGTNPRWRRSLTSTIRSLCSMRPP